MPTFAATFAATSAAYAAAALAEIAGRFAVRAWLRLGRSALWLAPGMLGLALFGWLPTRVEAEAAGRAYAAYGGVDIAASILWLWLAEGRRPDRFDLAGAALCLAGTLVILLGPRGRWGRTGWAAGRPASYCRSATHAEPAMLILLSICLLAQPDICKEDRIDLSFEARSPFVCLRNAQSALATWQESHPEWHVERWRCVARGSQPRDL